VKAQRVRKMASLNTGTLSPNPGDLALSRQNGCFKLETLERRTGLRRDATRAPLPVPEWQGTASKPTPSSDTNQTRTTLANARQKLVLTKGSTITSLRSEQACPWEIGSSQVAKLRHDPVCVRLSMLLRRSRLRTPASKSLHPRFQLLDPEVFIL
jgi:hypothetical protein